MIDVMIDVGEILAAIERNIKILQEKNKLKRVGARKRGSLENHRAYIKNELEDFPLIH